jgi:tetratricopeptide (TPR) repeat protein
MSGQSHYNLNEFSEALQDFKEAYRLHPDPAFLFNIAQCERQLGDFDEAIKFYRSYLRNKPEAPNAKEVQKKIDELKALSEGKRKSKEGAPAGVSAPSTAPPAMDSSRGTAPPPPPVAPLSPPPAASAPPPAAVPTLASPPEAATATSTTPGADLTAKPAASEGEPIYKQWWLWAGVGAVVVGGVVAAVVLSSGSASAPSSALGNKKVF